MSAKANMPATSLREFKQNGFAILPAVVAKSQVSRLAEQLTCIPGRTKAGLRHAMQNSAVAALAHDPALLAIASQILGANVFPFRATLFDKSPNANWLVVWHQDTALPLRERREIRGWGPWSVKDGIIYAHAPATALRNIVALRVHLDESTVDNGCLRVLSGTHRHGILEDGDIDRLVHEMQPYNCLLPRGGILAMSPLIVHSSSKSQVATPRRVLHIEYAASHIPASGLELAVA
jgi:ectoine hydroxylase-related dioxygenase (phytanoyl-CoA dioxygenase family)